MMAHTRILSLIRLFLYPLSSVSKRAVSVLLAVSVFSIHASSLCASGSSGAAARSRVHASLYRIMSEPLFASATAALRASTRSGTQHLPMSIRRSYRVRPTTTMEALEARECSHGASIVTEMPWEHRTDIVLNVEIKVKLGHVCHRDSRSAIVKDVCGAEWP